MNDTSIFRQAQIKSTTNPRAELVLSSVEGRCPEPVEGAAEAHIKATTKLRAELVEAQITIALYSFIQESQNHLKRGVCPSTGLRNHPSTGLRNHPSTSSGTVRLNTIFSSLMIGVHTNG